MNRQYRVLAGPYRAARRYAQRRGWSEDEYIIVTRGHQLHGLDPALIAGIVLVQLDLLGQRTVAEIREAIAQLKALWPVPLAAA